MRNYREVEDVRCLCVRKNWFTCGSSRQYERMFNMVRADCAIKDIALIIWVCSENAEMLEIISELKKIMEEGETIESQYPYKEEIV